ncbi:hypothetical protein BCR44DRAFT_1443927 [Catenaria anguillulae PL171]|uniref:Uncharacterized protein n=1 Tax=Catenaria anguillulae PL171 TaxID=765915 RepID=A0A1Y2H835_9FUNG|nr:hypothetical protein BCR44DRAFT_1443927 [Catenaria anguillulae PL171]
MRSEARGACSFVFNRFFLCHNRHFFPLPLPSVTPICHRVLPTSMAGQSAHLLLNKLT